MKDKKIHPRLIAAMGIAILTIEALAVTAVAPRAMTLLESHHARSLVQTGRLAAEGVSAVARERTVALAGDVLIGLLQHANRIGGLMLSITPGRHLEVRTARCRIAEGCPLQKRSHDRLAPPVAEPPPSGAGRAGAWTRDLSAT